MEKETGGTKAKWDPGASLGLIGPLSVPKKPARAEGSTGRCSWRSAPRRVGVRADSGTRRSAGFPEHFCKTSLTPLVSVTQSRRGHSKPEGLLVPTSCGSTFQTGPNFRTQPSEEKRPGVLPGGEEFSPQPSVTSTSCC